MCTHARRRGGVPTNRHALRASTALNGYLLGWTGLGQVLWLERRVWQRGRGGTLERACAITSLLPAQANAEALLALWRGHWGIETRLHDVRDVTMGEDACRVRTGPLRGPSRPCATR